MSLHLSHERPLPHDLYYHLEDGVPVLQERDGLQPPEPCSVLQRQAARRAESTPRKSIAGSWRRSQVTTPHTETRVTTAKEHDVHGHQSCNRPGRRTILDRH